MTRHPEPGGLLAEDERYRLLAENATDIVALTRDGVLEWVSPSVTESLGWLPEELVGQPTDPLLHPDDVPVVMAARAEAAEGGAPRVRVRFRTKRGDHRWFEFSTRMFLDATGNFSGAVSSLRDVTPEVRANEAIEGRDARLRATLDGLLDPCVLYQPVRDDRGTIVDLEYADANRAACEDTGRAYEQLVGRHLLDLFPSVAATGLVDRFVEALATGVPLVLDSFEDARDRGSDRVRRTDIRAVRIADALSVTWRDVTERDSVQRALADSEARYRLLADHASDVVCETDADGVVRWVSPSVTRVLGWRAADLVGRQALELLSPDDVDLMGVELDRTRRGASHTTVECRVRTATGDLRWMAAHGHRITDDDGAITAIVVGLRDCQDEVVARRAHTTLSAGSALLVRAERPDELLAQVCQIPVDQGGYLFSWYGRPVDDAERSVEAMASSRSYRDYLDDITISWGEGPRGQGPTGTALRTGTTRIVEDFAAEATYRPWLAAARARGFRSSISLPVFVDDEIDGALMVYAAEVNAFDVRAVALLEDLASQLGYGLTRLRERDKLDRALDSAIDLLAAAVDSRDPYTAGHQSRVAMLAVAIGEHLGLDPDRLAGLSHGASIHDVGKIAVPSAILTRPGRLAPEEMALVQRHSVVGWEIVNRFDWPWPVASMVRQHHERMNGSGYPDGLVGDDILLESRIIAVADVFEAMAAARPYRAALGADLARSTIVEGSGDLFDPAVVEALEAVLDAGFDFATVDHGPG